MGARREVSVMPEVCRYDGIHEICRINTTKINQGLACMRDYVVVGNQKVKITERKEIISACSVMWWHIFELRRPF